jgi:hypothetical protein
MNILQGNCSWAAAKSVFKKGFLATIPAIATNTAGESYLGAVA